MNKQHNKRELLPSHICAYVLKKEIGFLRAVSSNWEVLFQPKIRAIAKKTRL